MSEVEHYKKIKFMREFESLLLRLFSEGKLSGTTHTSIGQESTAIGIAEACNRNDIFVSNHRCHAHLLAHVGLGKELLAEIVGVETGICGGVGGSQHLCVPGKFYSNGIQGGILPLAAGLALAQKIKKEKSLTTVFIGDGTTGEGAVYESLNIASMYKLPLLTILEDNGIAQTTLTEATISGDLVERFKGFGIFVKEISYPTPKELSTLMPEIVDHVRNKGPAMLIVKSARVGPHSKGDDTRSEEAIQLARKNDPLNKILRKIEETLIAKVDQEVSNEIDELYDYAYKISETKTNKIAPEIIKPKYLEINFNLSDFKEIDGEALLIRINKVLDDYLKGSDSFIMGEDIVDPYGGAFKVTRGLSTNNPGKVLQSPISELGMVGIAAGAALAGCYPIVEIMFGDFILLAVDQIINHAAKYNLMYNNQVKCPLIIRAPMGAGRGYGPTHSQSLEKHLCGVPGLNVIAINPYVPIKPIYESIKRSNSPTIIIENKVDYTARVKISLNEYNVEICDSAILYDLKEFNSTENLLITYGGGVNLSMRAQQLLFLDEEIEFSVLAVTQLSPLNLGIKSVNFGKYKKIIIYEEGMPGWNFGSEVISTLVLAGVDAKFSHICSEDTVIPSARELESCVIKNMEYLINNIVEVFNEA